MWYIVGFIITFVIVLFIMRNNEWINEGIKKDEDLQITIANILLSFALALIFPMTIFCLFVIIVLWILYKLYIKLENFILSIKIKR